MAVAGLPMYDLPELRPATDAWWAGLARALRREGIVDVPDRLTREQFSTAIWQRPDLLLSQICGYDIVDKWRERLTYIATPCYTAPGCQGFQYSSLIVVPANAPGWTLEDLRGSRCAINGYASHSGCNTLRATFAPLARDGRFFRSVVVSGSHVMSVDTLERGEADVAAIDCITYALLVRHRPRVAENIRVVARTVAAAVGPYITRGGMPDDFIARLRGGLAQAMHDPDLATARAELFLGGFEVVTGEDYEQIRRIEAEAAKLGYQDFSAVAT